MIITVVTRITVLMKMAVRIKALAVASAVSGIHLDGASGVFSCLEVLTWLS
jgi:hypothetical protein